VQADRVRELDGLRGIAVLVVLAFHVRPQIFFFGWAAVDLFFVLSGYLITGIILRHGEQEAFLRQFYIRRSLRIWPIYYLMIVLIALLASEPQNWLPSFATYTQYLSRLWSDQPLNYPWYLTHTWTLAVEEQFYLIWPILVLSVDRKHLIRLIVITTIISVILRGCGVYPRLLIARSDGFALGALLAALPHGIRPFRKVLIVVAIAAAAFLFAMSTAFGCHAILGSEPIWPGSTVLALEFLFAATVGLCVLYSGHPILGILRNRLLLFLGTISYGIYLFHLPILAAFESITGSLRWENGLVLKAIRLASMFALPAISWVVIEQPILSLKRFFHYRSSTAAAPATQYSSTP
jgi:peptidoglycan/LPS O-acetylase OafA/YrhL